MQDADNSLVIIIPTFNRREVTLACVRKLISQSDSRTKIFVCDSHSTDGTQQALREFSDVEVIDVGSGAWWSAAVNVGVKRALDCGFQKLMIVNDDIDFDADLIRSLVAKANINPGHIISASQLTSMGIFLGIKYSGLFRQLTTIWTPPETGQIEVQTSNGCCILIPAEIFRRIGIFNEKFCPHQYGDSEFQIRAWHVGYPTLACPDIRIEQLGSTDYYRRLTLGNMLRFEGSPVHFTGYLFFGKALFKSWAKFFLLGICYHFSYFKSVIKAVITLSRRDFSRAKKDRRL